MATINQIVAQIRTALFGKDVRENIAQGIEKCYTDVTTGETLANTAATNANNKATLANNAATAANNAASAANTAASNVGTTVNNAVDKIVQIKDQQSQLDPTNKIWIKSESVEYQVPTWDEFTDLKSAVDDSMLDKYDMEFVGTYYDGNYSTATPPVFSGDGTVKKSAYWSTLVIPVPVGKKIILSGFPAQGGAASAWLNSSNPADVKEKAWNSQYNNRTVDVCKTAWLGISDYNYKGNTNNHAYVDKFEAVYETIDGIEHLRIIRNQCDVENATTGYYYTATGKTSADNTYTIFPSIPVKKGEVFYSNRGSYIRSASSYFETVEGRTLLSTYDNVTALDANFIQLNGFVAPSDGNILITTQTSTKGTIMIVNGDVPPDTYSGHNTALGATVLDKKIVIGTVKPEDTSFYTMVSNLLNPDTLQSGKVYYETSTGTAETYSINYVRVKQGHIYSSNGYLNKNFSWFENHLGVRTILTSYEDYVVSGVGNDFIGLTGFVAPDDGYLRITTNPDSNTAVTSIIEYAQQPTVYTAYGEPYKIFLNGQEALQTHKTLNVKKDGSGDFTSLSECINYVNSNPRYQYTVYVGAGEYDLITELTAIDPDYFDGTKYGLALTNKAHYIFSSNSKVVCNYEGDNTNVKNLFSPFNCKGGGAHTGFILENLTLEASNVRYCVHDETNGQERQYRNEYLNCSMKIDNTNNPNGYPQCIGGGLGHNSEIIIRNCYFESADTTSSLVELVTYHNANTSAASSYRNIVIIDACYFAGNNTSCRCSYCGNTSVKSRMMVSNCSMAKEPRVIQEVSGSPYVNMELIKWNNQIRT